MNQKQPVARRRRRKIRFNSFEQILTDAEKILGSKHVECLGNWTPGQIFEHLAKSFRSSMHESKAVLPLWRRIIAKIVKPFALRFGLPSGIQIEAASKVAADEFIPRPDVTIEEGFELLKQVLGQLSTESMTARHNLFGHMSSKDWEMMHCRHADLHLSYLLTDN